MGSNGEPCGRCPELSLLNQKLVEYIARLIGREGADRALAQFKREIEQGVERDLGPGLPSPGESSELPSPSSVFPSSQLLDISSSSSEFILQTDASNLSTSAVLLNNDLRPVAYASRPLNNSEKNYPTIQKEMLAVVWGIKYFRPYLFGRKFTIMTDHKPLVYLFGIKDPSSRLLTFPLTLEEYDFKIVYIKGKDNVIADALSRICITSDELKEMNSKLMAVMTRAQKRREEEKKVMNESNKDESVIPSVSTDKRPDQPRVEMKLVEGEKLKLEKSRQINIKNGCFSYNDKKKEIYKSQL